MKNTLLSLTLILSACLLGANSNQAPAVAGIVYLSDFGTLQEAVNAAQNGGTIIVPRGAWEGDAVIPADKYVHLQGVSPAMIGQSPPLGSAQWDHLLINYPNAFLNGSVLRGHITATANASKLSMTNIVMIGHGEGIAVDLGSASTFGYGGVFDNVDFGNYETAVRAEKVYNLTINKSRIYGVGTGLILKNGNLIRLRDIDIINCTLGADLKGEIAWYGGSVQACSDGVKAYLTSGYMGQIHFEQIANVSLDFDGYGSKLDPNYYASNSGKIIVRGYNNILDIGWATNVEFVYPRSSYNFVTMYGNYSAGGWQDRITTIKNIGTISTQYVDQHSGQVYFPDGVVIKGADGKNYRLTVTNGALGLVEVK